MAELIEKPKEKNVPETAMDDLLLGRMRELVPTGDGERNWRGVLIALLVIMAVLGLILASTVILSPPDKGPRATRPKIPLKDVISKKYEWRNNATWISDSEIAYRDYFGGISLFNVKNLSVIQFLKNTTFRMLNAVDFLISPDKKYVVFISDFEKIYKHRSHAIYRILDVQTLSRYTVGPTDTNFEEVSFKLTKFKFAPIENAYAFVYENNLYYSNSSKNRNPIKLTSNGSRKISNGLPDWLYQQEIFKIDEGFWFSPNGRYLVYAVFNDSSVDEVKIPLYLNQDVLTIFYPKRGRPNPRVSLYIVDLRDEKYPTKRLSTPKSFETSFGYLLKVYWKNDNQINSVWMKRGQNASVYMSCLAPSFNCSKTYSGSGWGEDDLVPLEVAEDWRCDLEPLLVHGSYNGSLYFEAKLENKPNERHLFRIKDGSSNEECLTCPQNISLSQDIDNIFQTEKCLFVTAKFSKNGTYYMLECLGPETPTVIIVKTVTNSQIAIFENNTILKDIYDGLSVPQVKIFKIETSEGRIARAKLKMPAGLTLGEEMTFPLLVKVSYRPGEVAVASEWKLDFDSYLVSEHNFLLLEVQPSSRRTETDDYLSVVRYISEMEFVDSTKIGLIASGYGAHLAVKIIAQDPSIFKSTVFINGVFSWNHYNSFWSERYSLEGDVLDFAGKIGKNTKLLLIHGTSELNEQYCQTMFFSKALIQEGIIYTHLAYPDANNDFDGYSKHLYTVIENFFHNTLEPIDYTEWETGTSYFNLKAFRS